MITSHLLPQPLHRNRGRLRRKHTFLTGLAGIVALVLVCTRAPAGPAPEVSLEPAFELAPDPQPAPVPLRWAGAWVLAKVTINGADAGWFMLATGWGMSCIDPLVAARLKLPMVAKCGLMDGFIEDAKGSQSKRYRVDALQCGAASIQNTALAPYEMKALSGEPVRMYGEGISGVLGWDLLKTLPFVLDEPGLQLVWQRQATPAEGAARVPVIEKAGCPFIEITAGNGFKTLAMLNTGSAAVSIQRPYLKKHAEKIWDGPAIEVEYTFFGQTPDDDDLPVDKYVGRLRSARWLAVECAGIKRMLPAHIDPRDDPAFGEVQLGYGWLRKARVLFDGPGKALWLQSAASTPEVELLRKGRPALSPYLSATALKMAIDCNDPVAVKALVAAGLDVKGSPDLLPLARACAGNSREAAFALLEAGAAADPEPDKPISETPLVAACRTGDPVLIQMLLKKGADPDRATLTGFTPLMAAARAGGPAAVQALRGKAHFPTQPNQALDLMGDACAGGNLLLAKEMLELIPVKLRINIPWTAFLEKALLCGHEEIVVWILKTGKPGLAAKGEELPPLLAAILPSRMEKSDPIRERLVTKLLAAGADPNAARKGVTPLLLAARHGNSGMVKALVAAGAKTTATDYKSRDPLMRAAAANQPPELIALLLQRGVDLDAEDPNTDLTVLATYAMHGNLEACAALLSAGADPNAKSTFGPTPLLMATNGHRSTDEDALAVVKLLLKHGAKSEASSRSRTDPGLLFGAISMHRSTLIKPLVEAGAPVNQEMYSKITPLALAAAVSRVATVEALLDVGADPRTLDVMGISPLAHAAAAGNTASMAVLLARGASPDATSPEAKPPIWVAASGGQLCAVRALLAAGADATAVDPQSRKTALETARSRGDQSMVKLLENAATNK